MPRIIVTTDTASSRLRDTPVLLSESVNSVHLATEHAAAQLIERLAWAVGDAEDAEDAHGWDLTPTKRRTDTLSRRSPAKRPTDRNRTRSVR
jgi:hypothetical protein